jgi:hypothetical protein
MSRLQGRSAAGRIRSIEESNDLIGNGTRDLLACGIFFNVHSGGWNQGLLDTAAT